MADCYYSPSIVDHWLRSWHVLTARTDQLHSPGISPIRVSGNPIADPLRLATIQADILSAHNSLGPATTEYKLIYLAMQGYELPTIADLLYLRRAAAAQLYWRAVRAMATTLGWERA